MTADNSPYGPDLARLKFCGHRLLIVSRLARESGRPVPFSALMDAVYGGVKSGGPECAAGSVRAAISDARGPLMRAGWAIQWVQSAGYKLVRAS